MVTPKIERDIPIPPSGRERTTYPTRTMEVGESFLYQFSYKGAVAIVTKANKQDGKRFTLRRTADGIRIWRIQ